LEVIKKARKSGLSGLTVLAGKEASCTQQHLKLVGVEGTSSESPERSGTA